ncbi:hypothetical protein PCK1_000918 [Pneumocystis canis]|nr:hypothetical protein PCK1_000918 [Pneumocystis canis]
MDRDLEQDAGILQSINEIHSYLRRGDHQHDHGQRQQSWMDGEYKRLTGGIKDVTTDQISVYPVPASNEAIGMTNRQGMTNQVITGGVKGSVIHVNVLSLIMRTTRIDLCCRPNRDKPGRDRGSGSDREIGEDSMITIRRDGEYKKLNPSESVKDSRVDLVGRRTITFLSFCLCCFSLTSSFKVALSPDGIVYPLDEDGPN